MTEDVAMKAGAETRRDRVRRILIEPLIRSGMRKQTRMKSDEHAAMLDRLAEKLGHLTDERLAGLVAYATRHARGDARNQWPDEVTIVSRAYELQPPPPRKCPYVVSVMRSRAGQRAREAGYHVELLMAARKFGPPFGKLDLERLAHEARRNREEVARVTEQIARDTAPQERRQWLDWYLRHEEEAIAIMDRPDDDSEEEVAA